MYEDECVDSDDELLLDLEADNADLREFRVWKGPFWFFRNLPDWSGTHALFHKYVDHSTHQEGNCGEGSTYSRQWTFYNRNESHLKLSPMVGGLYTWLMVVVFFSLLVCLPLYIVPNVDHKFVWKQNMFTRYPVPADGRLWDCSQAPAANNTTIICK